MKTCTYDNPATMCRECWQDGRLICSYSCRILPPYATTHIPKHVMFFGANVGNWGEGKVWGNLEAMNEENSI